MEIFAKVVFFVPFVRHRVNCKMARPDYTGMDISVPPVRRNVTPKPKTPPNGRRTQGVNQTNLKQVKRRRLDRETELLLKDVNRFAAGRVFVVLLLGSTGPCAATSEMNITCEAGSFTAGESAFVTCNFHTDMSADRRGILIEHLQNNDDVTDALVCYWKNEEQEHQCTTAEGSTNDIVINNVLRHEIPNVSKENAGTYICFVVPEKGSKSQSCEMTVEDGPADVTEATTTANGTVSFSGDGPADVTEATTTANGTVSFSGDGPANVPEATTTNGTVSFSGDNSFHVTLFVGVSIASVVILLVAAVLVFVVFKRKRRNVSATASQIVTPG